MSWTAHRTEDEIKEHFEDAASIAKKGKQLAEMIRTSKHFIMFTGAGISTAAGIADYRGPEGVWTLADRGGTRSKPSVPLLKAVPTYTHMAILMLLRHGYLKYLVSQNCDGLHLRSGVRSSEISELHGNANLEICQKCKRRYLRDFDVCRRGNHVHDHRTDRNCDNPKCRGPLHDSIINFGENLDSTVLGLGFSAAKKADLCLVLGSSLTVTPAANIPLLVGQRKKNYVIVNLQKTHHDPHSNLRIFCKCDDIMKVAMDELGIKVPQFRLKRLVRIDTKSKRGKQLVVQSLNPDDNTPYDFLRGAVHDKEVLESAPFVFQTAGKPAWVDLVTLFFYSHYGEPNMTLRVAPNTVKDYYLFYNPWTREWGEPKDNLDDDPTVAIAETVGKSAPAAAAAASSAGAAVGPQQIRIKIGNEATTMDESRFRWTCFVRGDEQQIVSVKFDLHETFDPPSVVVSQSPFELTRIGWGVFTIRIEIRLKDGRKVRVRHPLKASQGVHAKTVTIK